MRIAYIGPSYGTSLHRAMALERLGHDITVINLRKKFGKSMFASKWLAHTSGFGLQPFITAYLLPKIQDIRPDIIWVNQEPFLGSTIIHKLRAFGAPIVNYTNDDPFSITSFAKRHFRSYRKALSEYDLIAAMREVNIEEMKMGGGRNVMRVFMSADEIVHHPHALREIDCKRFASEVAFVGSWMPERGPFMARLVELGVPLAIWGDRWEKADEWEVLRPHWRGSGMYGADDYAKAIQCAKINLGLLSKGNRDLHTRRSMEISALGGLLCAERTSEHQALYLEDKEAVFWNDADECAEKCKWLLKNDDLRKNISRDGRERCLQNGYYNEQVLDSILAEVKIISANLHNTKGAA